MFAERRVFAILVLVGALFPTPADATSERTVPRKTVANTPVFPFGSNGLCSKNCPKIGGQAVIDYLSVTISGQNTSTSKATLNAGDTILFLYVGLDNGGYSNWWTANGALVSDSTAARANLGQATSNDGNDLKILKISCGPKNFNNCKPSMTWYSLRLDAAIPSGAYSLELTFTPFQGSGLSPSTVVLGPAFLTINPAVSSSPTTTTTTSTSTTSTSTTTTTTPIAASRGLAGKVCATLGRVREQNGVRFACIQSGSKKIWLKLG